MAKSKINPQACFFVTTRSLQFFIKDKDKPEVIELSLSNEIVQDLEIVSPASLERVLRNWLDQLKIIPGQVSLILDSSVYFVNQVAELPMSNSDQVVQEFLDIVPFSEVCIKNFPLQKGACTTVINQNFFQPLIDTLEKVGFIVISVSPSYILGIDFVQTPFSKELATQILNNIELLTQYSFITKEAAEAKLVVTEPFLSVRLDAKVITMILVLLGLAIVLIVLLKVQKLI